MVNKLSMAKTKALTAANLLVLISINKYYRKSAEKF